MKKEAENIAPAIDQELGVYWTAPAGGLARIWQLPLNHRFRQAFAYHDSMWDLMMSGKAPYPTSKPVDLELLRLCRKAAGKSEMYRDLANTFYLFCRGYGRKYWRPEGYPEVIAKIREGRL